MSMVLSDVPAAPTAPIGLPETGGASGALVDQGAYAPADAATAEHHQKLFDWIEAVNIADDLDASLLTAIGQRVRREYDIDVQSRSEWKDKTEEAMKLAMQIAEEKTYPWPKASNVIFPLITTGALQFGARAYPAVVAGRNVVKGVVEGDDEGFAKAAPDGSPAKNPDGSVAWVVKPGAKRERANRVADHMSFQLLDEQPEWEPETDKMLNVVLPIVGTTFRKSYFDPAKGRNMSLLVLAENLIINYHAKSLELAPRITEEIKLYPLEITERERAGVFLEIEYGGSPGSEGDEDAPHSFLEQHRSLDLDEDGYPEPYIVTIHRETSQVVRITARYDADGIFINQRKNIVARIEPIQYYTAYIFLPSPDSNVYGLGFGQLLKPINEAVNTTLNMLLDSGHLANTGGGFIGKGLSMNAGSIRFQPGEYKPVNVPGNTVRESIVPLQFPGPSPVLFQLLGMLIEAGRDIAAVKDILTGNEPQAGTPAATTLALIEQGLKVFTSIYKRVHRSLKQELQKLYRLNRVYLSDQAGYRVGDAWKNVTRDDYAKSSGVEPVSDPTMVSDMQKLGRAQFLMQFKDDPMCDGMEIRRRVLIAASVEDVEKILKPNAPPPPALIAKGLELEQKGREIDSSVALRRSEELKNLAQAISFMATADKTIGDGHMAWISQQLDIARTNFEASNAAQPSAGNNTPGLPGMAPPPGQQGLPALPPGLPGNAPPGNVGAMGSGTA